MYHKNIVLATQRSQLLHHHPHIDDNNNISSSGTADSKSEKYSLRQRHKRVAPSDDGDADDRQTLVKRSAPAANRAPRGVPAPAAIVSALAPVVKTLSRQTNTSTAIALPKKKAKPKSAPLSKYRRKTANARERTRMREINSAFENLRKFVPLSFGGADESAASTNEKLTKITTLRLAMKYIQSLNDVLHCGGGGAASIRSEEANSSCCDSDASSDSSSRSATHGGGNNGGLIGGDDAGDDDGCIAAAAFGDIDLKTSDIGIGYGLQLNEESKDLFKDLLMTAYGSTDTHRFGKTSSRRFLGHSDLPPATPNHTAYAGKPSTPAQGHNEADTNTIMFNQHQPGLSASSMLHDIGLMFESDGESLHLSEPCLSPPSSLNSSIHQHHQHLYQRNNLNHNLATAMPTSLDGCSSGTGNGALELGALLADSDSDSLELSEPCPLSPLSGLDVLGPFSDLLMHSSDFGEQQHLEMYLT